jgi:glycosyltransferase involved in cell wall biosynthesis
VGESYYKTNCLNSDLTIVMCCYNGGKYLDEALTSLLNQTKLDFEFIFINDGSNDASESIVMSKSRYFRDFKYIYQKNQGLQKSRNLGLQMASKFSRFIMFLDSDDTFHSDFIGTLYSQIVLRNGVSSIHCDIEQFGNICTNEKYGDLFKFKFGLPFPIKKDKINLFDILSGNHRLVEASGMYRKSVIEKIGGWDDKNFPKGNTYGESIPLFTSLILEGDIIFIDKVLYNYRIHEQQITNMLLPNTRAIEISTDGIMGNYFSFFQCQLIKIIVFNGSNIVKFKKRYKFLIRNNAFEFVCSIPFVLFWYVNFSILRFFLNKKSRYFLFS